MDMSIAQALWLDNHPDYSLKKPDPAQRDTEWGVLDHKGKYLAYTTAWNGRTAINSETFEVYVYRKVPEAQASNTLVGKTQS